MRLRFGPTRDAILFVSGLALLGYETLGSPEPRALLIAIAAAMIGLPATLFTDRRFIGPPPEPPTQPSSAQTQEPGP